jgi:DNA-binding cell septation regulator SpoVG
MNLFRVVNCIDFNGEIPEDLGDASPTHEGPAIIMNNVEWPSTYLFFPIQEENMEFINKVMNGDEDIESLSLFKTMMDSWKSSNSFLTGIVCDVHFSPNDPSPKITVDLALADGEGLLTSMVAVSLFDAVIISLIKDIDFVITDRFLNALMPDRSEEVEEFSEFPEDHNINDIVRDIMEAPVKEDKNDNDDSKSSGKKSKG